MHMTITARTILLRILTIIIIIVTVMIPPLPVLVVLGIDAPIKLGVSHVVLYIEVPVAVADARVLFDGESAS